jgi:hypothetical protein
MICTACGKTNIDSAVFCEQCGTNLRAQPAAGPGIAVPPSTLPAPFPPPAATVPVSTTPFAQSGEALIASLSLGEKISGAGAIAAIIGFFLPWISYATPGVAATAQTSFSGLDLGKTIGAVYLILLNAALAAVVCYLSSKAAPPRKLIFAGWLAFIGALCGPANLMALIFVSKLSAIAGAGLWIFSLGYTAIAAGGLMSIRDFSKRVY